MAKMPINFAVPSESAIASYNFVDTLRLTGYVTAYAVNVVSSTGSNILSLTPLESEIVSEDFVWVAGTASPVLKITKNWDLDFEVPQTINGRLYGRHTFQCSSAVSQTRYTRVDILVYKIPNGGAAELIATGTGSNLAIPTSVVGSMTALTYVDVDNLNLAKGDTLRLTTKLYTWMTVAGSNNNGLLWTDGANRPVSENHISSSPAYTNDTNVVFSIPFKLNL